MHNGVPTPCLCGFWHGHPYIPVHILENVFHTSIISKNSNKASVEPSGTIIIIKVSNSLQGTFILYES